jgi:ubiquinone/menaquinone biosynthesis C-methylase UbiE
VKPDPSPIHLNQNTYDQIAPLFAERNAAISGDLEAQALRLLERLPPGARILDLGCGPGRDLAWLEAHDRCVFGADLSRGMLRQARQVTRAPLCQMDMRSLGFPPAAFQGVWCCAALLHLPKNLLPGALAEIARVLVPGGFLSLTVQMGDGEGIEPVPYQNSLERFFARYQPSEMEFFLEQGGFTILQHGESIYARHWLWYDNALR